MDFSQEALRTPFAITPFVIIIVILVPTLIFLFQYLLSKKAPTNPNFFKCEVYYLHFSQPRNLTVPQVFRPCFLIRLSPVN